MVMVVNNHYCWSASSESSMSGRVADSSASPPRRKQKTEHHRSVEQEVTEIATLLKGKQLDDDTVLQNLQKLSSIPITVQILEVNFFFVIFVLIFDCLFSRPWLEFK
jgi:hypothetical protein